MPKIILLLTTSFSQSCYQDYSFKGKSRYGLLTLQYKYKSGHLENTVQRTLPQSSHPRVRIINNTMYIPENFTWRTGRREDRLLSCVKLDITNVQPLNLVNVRNASHARFLHQKMARTLQPEYYGRHKYKNRFTIHILYMYKCSGSEKFWIRIRIQLVY